MPGASATSTLHHLEVAAMAANSVGSDRADIAAPVEDVSRRAAQHSQTTEPAPRRAECGASAVEFALLAPALLAFIVPVIIQFG
jgi:hypothetical protein